LGTPSAKEGNYRKSSYHSPFEKGGARGDLKKKMLFHYYKISPNPSFPKRGNKGRMTKERGGHLKG